MTPKAYETLAELFNKLTPTTLAAIVANLGDDTGTMAAAATALAMAAGEHVAGDDDFAMMMEEAIAAAGTFTEYLAAISGEAADAQREEDEYFYNGEVAASIDRWER